DSGEVMWTRTHTYADVFGQEKGSKIGRDLAQAKEIREQIESLKRNLKESGQEANSALEERIVDLEKDYAVWAVYPPVPVGGPGNTTSTPVSDGENVWAVFGTGIVSSHTFDGQRNWMRFVEAPGSRHSASPLLSDGRLIVHLNQLIALDPATGEIVWQVATPSRAGTAVVTRIDDTDVVVTPAGAVVRARDGELLAKDLFNLAYCSPLVADNVVYAVQNGSTKAIRLAIDDTGAVRPEVLWESRGAREHRLSSPVHHDGLLYSVTEKGILDVLDAETGERVYRQRLKLDDGRFDSSLAIAGDMLFVSSNQGKTLVMKPGREHVEVGRSELENFSSSPVFDRGHIYIRTQKNLYCLGQ
ncbi:MAG: PQQ-binding-like beta-propeller repeat protein, partial [Pirellulaceae bacterium]